MLQAFHDDGGEKDDHDKNKEQRKWNRTLFQRLSQQIVKCRYILWSVYCRASTIIFGVKVIWQQS